MGKVVGKVLKVGALVAGTVLSGGTLLAGLAVAGLSVASSLLAPKPKTPGLSRENIDRLRANVDPLTPRKTVIGNTAFATDIRDEEFTDNQEYFHRFIVCASHKVESIDEIFFDDQRVWSSGGGVEGDGVGYLEVATRLEGSAANAINISSRMGSTRRYTGLAYVHLKYKLTGNDKKTDSPYAQSITTRITIRGKGAALPDPRDVSQDMADQSTWVWDDDACRNPALALLFYLLGYKINGKLALGKGIPPERIDLDSFITAANICDESVTTFGGGTEPRYRCDGVWSEGDSPTTVIEMLKACMNADLDDVGGKLRLTIFHNDLATPDADFDDDDIIDAFTWQPIPSLDQSFNVVRGLYTDPSNTSLYQQAEYPELREASPDGIDRIFNLNLPMVQSADQAQRLAALRLNRQSYAGVFSAEFQATAWKITKNSVIRLTFAQTGFTQKLFRVADIEFRQDGRVPLTLREENAAIYADPTLVEPPEPIATTPYNPALNPLVQSLQTSEQTLIAISNPTDADPLDGLIQATDTSITIEDHVRTYADRSVAVTGDTLTTEDDGTTSIADETRYHIYYDDSSRSGGAVTFKATQTSTVAQNSSTNPNRHYVGSIVTDVIGGTGTSGGGSVPPGWDSGDYR
ncbi:hypothetical protein INR77_08815 [Erythrobacter sp. SCSIO 43205]|uniref:phage tail protein n=1 Tax=Erythrobacter sp. SCSIO 43205 TaxID=2779361 RepID=UPI001CA81409|nr:phage tail protein [Erythrobacter sp. SCSIO 43205]UAB76948.1 hypothetical protein INR77_08815 [Erythrobacter sp. SCSIO 43205]